MSHSQMDGDAYLLPNGSEVGAVKQAFTWLTDQWQDVDNRDTVIAVPAKGNLENVEDRLKPLIGKQAYKDLLSSDNRAELGKGITLHTMTKRIHPSRWGGGPVLALFVDDEQLEEIAKLRGVTAILVVPWIRDDVSKWEASRSPDIVEFDGQ